MAKRECISACVEAEEEVFTIKAFLEAVSEAAGDAPPSWLVVMYALIGALEAKLAKLSTEVRK